MRSSWLELIEHLTTVGRRALIVTQQTEIADWLRRNVEAGISGCPIDVAVLPDAEALATWMRRPADWTHPAEVALNMATAAYRNLGESDRGGPCVGLAFLEPPCDDAAETSQYIATQTSDETRLYSFALPANPGDPNVALDAALSRMLWALAGVTEHTKLSQHRADERHPANLVSQRAETLLLAVWSGRTSVVWSIPDGLLVACAPTDFGAVLSGAFNPLHAGHLRLQDAAEQYLGVPACFELPILNADKPPLDFVSIARRRAQFQQDTLALSCAATFVEKAAIFRNTTFVVGVDTALRVVDPRFYGGSQTAMHAALKRIGSAGCHFLVAGRQLENRFVRLDDVPVPEELTGLFEELPERLFRSDTSSTSIRRDSREA